MGRIKQLLESSKPTLWQRIKDLHYILNNSKSKIELISAREDVLTLLKEFPVDARLKNLKSKLNKKISAAK